MRAQGQYACALALLLAGCRASDPLPIASGAASPLALVGPVGSSPSSASITFVPDAAGANDYGLNALALTGLRSEAQRLGLPDPAVISTTDPAGYVATVERAATQARLVLGRGSALAEAFQSAAAAHPNVKFVLIDASLPNTPANLRTISFDLYDGAGLAGKLAAGVSQGHRVAFAGGKDTADSRQLAASFAEGAAAANVITAFTGSDDNQADAKRLAEGLISDRGADVLFAAASPGGLGAIAAASQRRALAIGIETDQYGVAPNAVLTSVVKNTDLAASDALGQFAQGTLTGGTIVLGVANGGVGLAALRDLAVRVPPEVRQAIGVPQ